MIRSSICLFLKKKIAEKEMGMSQGCAGFPRGEEIGNVIESVRCKQDTRYPIIIDFE
jgi:hypothetical protein